MKPKIKLLTITDSPKITTGFGNVARMLLEGFHNSGLFDLYAFGTLDVDYDLDKKLPYHFFPSNPFDEMGYRTIQLQAVNIQPDIIFLLYDPGNVRTFVDTLMELQKTGNLKTVPIVIYTPIEGFPVPFTTAELFSLVLDYGGAVVTYAKKSVEIIVKQYPQFKGYIHVVNHGLDHADFRKYKKEDRDELRHLAGFTDKFVVGSVGVNKRTKGFDNIIYTARCLKDIDKHHDVLFYLHTSPDNPTMMGYNLYDLAINYDVEDMIVFKPDKEKEMGGNMRGIPRDRLSDNFVEPLDPELALYNISQMGFIDRLNLLDCYLDLSQVEGWGLPAHEAMKCGVPTISVNDMSVRSEVYDGGVMWIEPEPVRLWNTWHTGVKLALVDPMGAAEAIYVLKESDQLVKDFWSNAAMDTANKYKWSDAQEKMSNIILETYENYEMSDM